MPSSLSTVAAASVGKLKQKQRRGPTHMNMPKWCCTLDQAIDDLNEEYNLDIQKVPGDPIYQSLRRFARLSQPSLAWIIDSFRKEAHVVLDKWKRLDNTRSKAYSPEEVEELRDAMVRSICAHDMRSTTGLRSSFNDAIGSSPSWVLPKIVSSSAPSRPRQDRKDWPSAEGRDDTPQWKPLCSPDFHQASSEPEPEGHSGLTDDEDALPNSDTTIPTPLNSSQGSKQGACASSAKLDLHGQLGQTVDGKDETTSDFKTCSGSTRLPPKLEDLGSRANEEEQRPRLQQQQSSQQSSQALEERINERLESCISNIWPCLASCLKSCPFAVAWEVTRISRHCGIDMSRDLMFDPRWGKMSYKKFLESLQDTPAFSGKSFPKRSDAMAWDAALHDNHQTSEGHVVRFTARANISLEHQVRLFDVELNPLELTKSHRMDRKFGADRFLEVLVPELDRRVLPSGRLKSNHELVLPKIASWMTGKHSILGRTWTAFFAKDARKKTRSMKSDGSLSKVTQRWKRVYFFREDSGGGCYDKVHQMLRWHLQLDDRTNWSQPYLKLFSRISLGLSPTWPSIVLEKSQIRFRNRDIKGKEVMNDGCARMSQGLQWRIVDMLGLGAICPCAFQGRFGSAKGMWIVDGVEQDGHDDEIWIETYPSQHKWRCDFQDEHQRTFEVNGYVRGSTQPADAYKQLFPILWNGARDESKMRTCLEQIVKQHVEDELGRAEAALEDPSACYVWTNKVQAGPGRQATESEAPVPFGPFLGGFPNRNEDQISFMVVSGFDPMKQTILQDLVKLAQADHFNRLKDDLKVKIGCSATLYMVADVWGFLEEGEVQVSFSGKFIDPATRFSCVNIVGRDVLVTRTPAHLPSDVQRAKAVFRPELSKLTDVIVFSTKGAEPLAGKLSGGDYDGDTAWVCWDDRIVQNFDNSPVPDCPDAVKRLKREQSTFGDLVEEAGGLEKGVGAMAARGLLFNCKESLLGRVTNYKEKFNYSKGTVSDEKSILLSYLISALVDEAKTGTMFGQKEWAAFQKEHGLPPERDLTPPAHNTYMHINDWLMSHVVKPAVEAGQLRFNEKFLNNTSEYRDADLTGYLELWEQKAEHSPGLKDVLTKLRGDLYELCSQWKPQGRIGSHWTNLVWKCHAQYLSISPRILLGSDTDKDVMLLRDPGLRCSDTDKDVMLPRDAGLEGAAYWALLKASMLFKLCLESNTRSQKKFAFLMGGRELMQLKLMRRQSGSGIIHVAGEIYKLLKINRKAVARQHGGLMLESGKLDDD